LGCNFACVWARDTWFGECVGECVLAWIVAHLSVPSSLFRAICCKSVCVYVVSRVVFFSKSGGRVLRTCDRVVGVLGARVCEMPGSQHTFHCPLRCVAS
jgi:hypothetical protein